MNVKDLIRIALVALVALLGATLAGLGVQRAVTPQACGTCPPVGLQVLGGLGIAGTGAVLVGVCALSVRIYVVGVLISTAVPVAVAATMVALAFWADLPWLAVAGWVVASFSWWLSRPDGD